MIYTARIIFALLAASGAHAAGVSNYQCKITRHTLSGAQSEALVFAGSAIFNGVEPQQKAAVSLKDGVLKLAVTDYYGDPAKPFNRESLACNLKLDCKAERIAYSPQGESRKPVELIPLTYGIEARSGLRPMIVLEYTRAGFAFHTTQLVGEPRLGMDVECVRR